MNYRLTWTLLLAASTLAIACEETETPPEREVAETRPQLPPAGRPTSATEAADTDVTPIEPAGAESAEGEETAGAGMPSTSDNRTARFLNFRAPKPATWIWQPPQNTMRIANYVVPAREGSDQADMAIFHGIQGSRDDNVTRWVNQFRAPDGGIVEPEITMHEVDGMPVTVVSLEGEYMGMGQQWYAQDQMMLAAILQAPGGDIHIKLVGPTVTVEPNREAFMEFVLGIEQVD